MEPFVSENLSTYPSVYVVEDEYLICALVKTECTMWAEVNGRNYYDHSNGILRSAKFVHIARVPVAELDKARKYTVHVQKLNERKPYYTDYGEVESLEFEFRPIRKKRSYNIVNLADSHSLYAEPILSGGYFGDDLDLLLMNGDIPNHSGNIEFFKVIYLISGGVTKGRVPCVFSRGNHDLRGIYAEQLADYTPVDRGGRSYFTFRLGPIWGVVMDCGEDKRDGCDEYGRTVCCHAFREEESRFLDAVIAKGDYKDAQIRLVVSHVPFAYRLQPPFDIEEERYRDWCAKLKAVRPSLWCTGHLHKCFTERPGGEHDTYGQPCVVVCSSLVGNNPPTHTSGAITLTEKTARVRYVNDKGEIKGDVRVSTTV